MSETERQAKLTERAREQGLEANEICWDCIDCSEVCGKLHGKRFKGHPVWFDKKGRAHSRVGNKTVCGIEVANNEGE